MAYIDPHLQPGEILLDRIQRSRKWYDVALSFLVDGAAALAVWFLFNQIQRMLLESFIRSPFGRTEYIVLNLFLGLVPFVVIVTLIQDFIFTFFVELALTDRRIFGRVSGLFWLKEIDFCLAEIEEVSTRFGYLYIRAGARRVYLSGFYNTRHFIDAWMQQRPHFRIHAARFEPVTEPFSLPK